MGFPETQTAHSRVRHQLYVRKLTSQVCIANTCSNSKPLDEVWAESAAVRFEESSTEGRFKKLYVGTVLHELSRTLTPH